MKRIVKPFGIAFAASGILGVVGFFAGSFVPEEHYGCMMLCIAACIWTMCFALTATRQVTRGVLHTRRITL